MMIGCHVSRGLVLSQAPLDSAIVALQLCSELALNVHKVPSLHVGYDGGYCTLVHSSLLSLIGSRKCS